MTPPHALGDWPFVNRVLVKDYQKPGADPPRCAFRIHIDVKVDESDVSGLESSLNRGDLKAVFDTLVTKRKLSESDNPQAWAMLKAALGQK